jgi:hypothetical protein
MKLFRKLFGMGLIAILFASVTLTIRSADDKDSDSEEPEDFVALGKEMAELWGERLCVSEQSSKHEERVISIACNAEYLQPERDKMLDLLFKKGYTFRGESYNIKGTTGHYWYKFQHKDGTRTRLMYVRLHIRSQGPLWGAVKPPARMAIYIDNLSTADELTAWQTLGIPLTFGLKPSETAKDLAQQVEEYKQESWISLDLKPAAFTEPDQTASIREIIEQELLSTHIKNSVELTGEVWGFVVRDLNNITTTVASTRALFSAMKAEEKTFVLLPARYNRVLSTTANLMGMNSHRVTFDMTAMCNKSPAKIWPYLVRHSSKGGLIVRFPASYKRCAHVVSRSLKRDGKIEFRKLSNFFGYRPTVEQ